MFRIYIDTLYPCYILALSLLYVRNIPLIQSNENPSCATGASHEHNSFNMNQEDGTGVEPAPRKRL